MKISDAFPSTYLKAADLQGRTVRVTIADCRMEHFDDESKPLLMFVGKDRGLILNKTNSGMLVAALGDETDLWRGRVVELYPDRVMFSGRMVDAIRLRVPGPAAPAATPAAVPTQAPTPAPQPDPRHAASFAAQAPAPGQPQAVPFDDDIPF